MASVHEIFTVMRDRLQANPSKVANMTAVYQFDLTGDDGGTYHARFDNGAFDIGEGAVENPGCIITISGADFVAMTQGKLNPMTAFMTGKIKLKGDMGLAMKLQTLLG